MVDTDSAESNNTEPIHVMHNIHKVMYRKGGCYPLKLCSFTHLKVPKVLIVVYFCKRENYSYQFRQGLGN